MNDRAAEAHFNDGSAAHASAVRIINEGRRFRLLPRDLALLILVRARLSRRNGDASILTESEIRGVYQQVDDLEANSAGGGFEARVNATRLRLLESGCLVRADTQKIGATDPEYVLSGIGDAIAEWNTGVADLSIESLMSIMEAFNSQLLLLVERSGKTTFDDDWRWIERQLRWVLTSMLRNVAAHQTMLDAAFDRICDLVPILLEKRNDESIDDCESILDRVVKTINDLYQVILQAASTAHSLLDRMEENARASPEAPTSFMSHLIHIAGQIGSITEWTRMRQKSWVEHHTFIHHFIRTVIRIDRNRRISEALKRDLSREPTWSLSVAAMPKARELREGPLPTPMRQAPRRERKPAVIEQVAATVDDLRTRLEAAFEATLVQGEARLSELLRAEAVTGTSLEDLARAAPWMMGRMVEAGSPDLIMNQWAQVYATAEVQELAVKRKTR